MIQASSKQQAGFTLIELVMVIVILGILAAFALPRFADLGGDARAASIEGLAGSLKSAAAIAHAKALVDNQTGATGSVTLEGQAIALVFGYPTAAGIKTAANVSAGAAGSNNDYQEDTSTAGTIVFGIMQASGTISANCRATYVQPANASSIGAVTVDSSGC